MSDFQILLLPKDNYIEWLTAAKDYALKFGVNMTSDPDSAGRYLMPQQVVTLANAPNGYPDQGDILAWFARHYPNVKVDSVPAKTPAELQAAFAVRIKANSRYAPLGPDFRRVWPANKCLVGLHGRADGRMQEADFQAVAQSRVEAVKLNSSAAPEDVDRLRAINPNMFIMVRLFADFKNRMVRPEDFASWVMHDMGRFYERGIRYFEIHNEVNLKIEGWTFSWQNGREFAQWWLTVRNALKGVYPEARFGWPGLSPDGFPMPERTNDLRFLDDGVDAVRAADFICLHCYWRDEAELRSPNGGMGHLEYRRRYPDKLLFITEFSNPIPNVDMLAKGRQYVQYYQALRDVPGLGAAFSFVVSASANFPYEAWRSEGGQINEIASAVAQRPF